MDWNKIKKIDWAYLVSRHEALLFNSVTINCYPLFKKVTGIDWRVKYISYSSGGPILHSRKELDWLKNFFSNCDLKKIKDFRHHLVYYVSQSEKLSIKLEKVNYEKLKQDKLCDLVKKYFNCVRQAHNFLAAMVVADKVLISRIFAAMPNASKEQKQKWLGILIYPPRDNSHIAEERSFHRLVAMYHRHNPELKKAVEQHVKNFGWIGARGYHFDLVWNDKLIIERVKSFLASGKNEMSELLYLDEIKRKRKSSAAKLQRQLGLNSIEARRLLDLAREYAYLRTWRTDVLYHCGYRVRNLFFEIFRRAGLDRELMPWCTYLEMIKIAQTGRPVVARKELQTRSKYYVSLKIGKQYEVISGRENYKKFESATERALPIAQDIRGNVAYPGVVRGRVSVVLTGHDISKVKRNDILVAVMTFPNFVPAMEKAAAFVTDEGGILCHAAIIAREMRKPCIIGTKIATKVLKDGDLVEVDATKGTVKILK